jgi:hypothetical protein
MTLFSRLFPRKRAAPPAAAPERPAPAVASPARPDAAQRLRAEEAGLSQALAAGDWAAVGRWVVDGSSTRVRQAAAQAITDRAQLEELIPLVRGKDKSAYRILARKRDELLAAERAARERDATVVAAADAIASHCERPFDASYASTLARLEARWAAVLPDASAERREAVTRHLEQARAVIEAQRRALEAASEREHLAAVAAAEAQRQREHEAQLAAAAAAEQAAVLEAERQSARAVREAQDGEVRDLVAQLRQLQAALERGNTVRAARLREAVGARLPQAPPLPAWFARQLEEADARLDELKDWNTFTVVPKRAELLQRMESLVGAEMSPEELARQIRRLRDEWRTLHRGAGADVVPERERFEQAAERAFEPCREHFARQGERRKENQSRREALIARLQALASAPPDDVPFDARGLQRALGEARREWREHAPVDQAVVADLQARFHAVLDTLQGRLDAEYARNVADRRALIARAAELASQPDTRQAIDGVRELQQAWKSAGLVPRHQDEALWNEFRARCDAIYERSVQEHAQRGAELQSNESRAVELCEQAERLATPGGQELAASQRTLAELAAAFDALELPRAAARGLRERWSRASKACDAALRRQRGLELRQAWTAAFAASAHVRAHALGVTRGATPDAQAASRATAEQAIAALDRVPREVRVVLERQLEAGAVAATAEQLAANEAMLRTLCVRAELAAGRESPAADLERRRELQMQRLVASMGGRERAGPGELDELALEWLAVGPVEASVHDALLERFLHCRDDPG